MPRLSILLERSEHTLEVRYQLPGREPSEAFKMSWGHVAPVIDKATEVLNRGDPRKLASLLADAPEKLGKALFRILLGDAPQWQPVLRAAMGQIEPDQPQPNPSFRGIRVHIATSDPLLVSLPWRLTAWNGRLLVQDGWRFAVTREAEPPGSQHMDVPARVIVVASHWGPNKANVPEPRHERTIREILAAAWPTDRDADYLTEVNTFAQFGKALSGSKPGEAIVYVYTTVKQHAGQPCVVLDGRDEPDLVPVHEIVKLFRKHPPRLVYLNTGGVILDDPLATVPIPLAIWRRTPNWTANTGKIAARWLHHWLTAQPDPIDALHDCQDSQLTQCSEAATLIVRSQYDTWATQRHERTRKVISPVKALDRDEPKAMIAKHLRELAQSRSQRVLAIVAHAESGNRLTDLWDQLRYELDRQGERIFAINWKKLSFPARRHQLDVDLPALLREELEREPDEPLHAMLRRHAPRVRGEVRRILWLNWGVCGKNHAQAELTKAKLCAWLRFTSEFLAEICPDDLRVVAYVGMETENSKSSDKLSRVLDAQLREPWARRAAFQLDELRPSRVSEKHLLKYLRDCTDCESTIHLDLAEYLIEATGGDFAQTVERLATAVNAGTWFTLHAELQRELGKQPASSVDDDETF